MTATPEGSTSHSMPRSKHRRKGRVRPRQNRKPAPQLPPLPSIDYEWEQHKSAVEEEQLRKMFGEEPPDGWTDDQIETMVEEIERAQRQDPLLEARLREMYGGDWDDWTDEDIDEMRRQMWNESTARKPDPAV
jgi:hypothetical protein